MDGPDVAAGDVGSSVADAGTRLSPGARVLVWAALAASTAALTWPGLTGTWVYDDTRMLGNPCFDDWGDVAAAYGRTAVDYFNANGAAAASSETYRPTTMAMLIATHVASPTAAAHHVLGWLLHLGMAVLLFHVLRAQRVTERAAMLGAALFAVHPVGVEAYVWINGRSDVCAALFVLGSALLAELRLRVGGGASDGRPASAWVWGVGALVLGFGAVSSKETSLVALVAVWAAALARAPRGGKRGSIVRLALAAAGGVTAYLIAWSAVRHGTFGALAPGSLGLADPGLWALLPKLVALGAGALVSPRAAPMQSMAYLAMRPLSPVEWGAALLLVLAALSLLSRRDFGGTLLLAGAVGTLLPTALVYDSVWLGFDRYLYLPLALVCLALGPHVARAAHGNTRIARAVALSGAVFMLVSCGATHMASTYYEGHLAFMTGGVRDEPSDPTRHLMMASELFENGHPDAAVATLHDLPPPPWPRAVVLGVLNLAGRLGHAQLYDTVLRRAVADGIEHPGLIVHRIHHALAHGDVALAVSLVPSVARTGACTEVAVHLQHAAQRGASAEREALERARAGLPCVRPR